ncbi:hypothetical protein Cgig2_015281 [Carnegiea gigantea]|uniref:DUF4283 domain-containing protein n=1 Tax=Carnegiea gigantea TaxID=171969 RepID=A0A9Q1K8G5_9CARY|nr:hypothetical protein Cgig2_015281 [Carnegiea gigantea]
MKPSSSSGDFLPRGFVSPGNQVAAQAAAIDQEFSSIHELNNETVHVEDEPEIEQARVTTSSPDEGISTTRSVISSYATMTDPNEVKPWNEEMDINIETLVSVPVWVRFLELDIKYYGLDSLSKIGSVLGIHIKIDKYTRDKSFLRYARLLIEMQLHDSFPDYVGFVNEHNVVVRQKVEYEWKPTKCNYCRIFGHTEEECRKKPKPRIEWRPILRQDPLNLAPPQLFTDEEGFVPVKKKAAAPIIDYRELPGPIQVQNNFNSLTEMEDPKNMHLRTEGGGAPWIGSVGSLEMKVKVDKAMLDFPWCPKPKPSFQFCDMWIRDPSFLPLMASIKA